MSNIKSRNGNSNESNFSKRGHLLSKRLAIITHYTVMLNVIHKNFQSSF